MDTEITRQTQNQPSDNPDLESLIFGQALAEVTDSIFEKKRRQTNE